MKIKNILLTSICLLSFSISSCANAILIEEDIQYGSLERDYLNIAYPKNVSKAGLILFIHGGAWIAGDKETYNDSIQRYAKKGYVCAAMNYTYVSKDYSVFGILDEITNALTTIKTYTQEKGITVNNAMLTGHSAGGHLSLLYGYTRPNESPIDVKCVYASAPPTYLDVQSYQYKFDLGVSYEELFSWVAGYDYTQVDVETGYEYLEKASPTSYVNEDTIPTVLAYGLLDELIPLSNFIKLRSFLETTKGDHSFVVFPTSGHALDKNGASTRKANKLFLEYANKYL